MYAKIHKSRRNVVAVSDEELLGKKFEEGKMQLEIKEHFFKGDSFDEESLIKLMLKEKREDSTFNIVGEKSVSAALKSGVISENNVGRVAGVPFALVLL